MLYGPLLYILVRPAGDSAGVARETDTALPPGAGLPKELDQALDPGPDIAAETDTALPSVGSIPEETDLALPAGAGLPKEADAALDPGPDIPSETDTAPPVISGIASEADSALPLGSGLPKEADVAQPVGAGLPKETDEALEAGAEAIFTYRDHAGTTTAATTLTFAVTIGAGGNGEVGVVAPYWVNIGGGTFDSVTVHVPDVATDPTGTPFTRQVGATRSGNVYRVELWTGILPDGTTNAEVVVGISDTANAVGVATGSVTGAGSPTASDTAVDEDGSTPLTGSLDVPERGCGLGFVMHNVGSRTYTPGGLTNDQDFSPAAGGNSAAIAWENFTTAQTGLAVSFTISGAASSNGLAAWISIGP